MIELIIVLRPAQEYFAYMELLPGPSRAQLIRDSSDSNPRFYILTCAHVKI